MGSSRFSRASQTAFRWCSSRTFRAIRSARLQHRALHRGGSRDRHRPGRHQGPQGKADRAASRHGRGRLSPGSSPQQRDVRRRGQLINAKPADLPTALAQKDADAIAVWEPWPSTAIVKVPGSVASRRGMSDLLHSGGDPHQSRHRRGESGGSPPVHCRLRGVPAMGSAELRRRRRDLHALDPGHRAPGDEAGHPAGQLRSPDLKVHRRGLRQDDHSQPDLGAARSRQAFDPAPFIDPQFYLYAEKTFPQFYADLPKIPESVRVGP